MSCPCPVCNGSGEIERRTDKAWLIDRIKAGREIGLKVEQIAKMIGRSPSTVEKYCHLLNIRKKTITDLVAEHQQSR